MSKGFNTQKAIVQWEEKTGQSAPEAEVIKLIAQSPPVDKIDNSVNNLTNCVHLSLSTNAIEKMINMPGLRNLKILSLGRNQIKKITGLDEVGATLEQLWISYNLIEKLDGLQPCIKLTTLFISNNKIKSWDEINKLNQLPELTNCLFYNNPIYVEYLKENAKEDPKYIVLKRLPQLKTLDGATVTDKDLKIAEEKE